MDNNQDLRIRRTHKTIRTAFFELMDTIGFDKITVQNLTQKAMISRTTFYLHYKDKFDLLDQIENEILEGLRGISYELQTDIWKNLSLTDEKPVSILIKVYNYVKANEQFFKLIMGKNGDPSFFKKLNETMKSVSHTVLDVKRLKIPEHYALAIVIGIQTSFINEWLNSGMKETPEELVAIITQVMQDVPKNIYL